MAKQKISITIDEETIKLLESMLTLEDARFRNRSHVIEYSLKKFLNENSKIKENSNLEAGK